jgi:hypothetical protein
VDVRPTDLPFDGASHRFGFSSYWNRGANNLGNYEFRWSLIDNQGNGWDILAPFQVVNELPTLAGDFDEDGAVDAADFVVWRNGLGTTYAHEEYDIWRADFGKTTGQSAALATFTSHATIPEPHTLLSASITAFAFAARRTPRRPKNCR